MVNCIRKK